MVQASGDGDVEVPPTIQALLAARLDQLEPPERTVLERGSVEGELFHQGAVRALTPEEATAHDPPHRARAQGARAPRQGPVGRRRRVPFPPYPHSRRCVREPPEGRPGRSPRAVRRLARGARRRARRARRAARVPPRAGLPVPTRAGPDRLGNGRPGRTGRRTAHGCREPGESAPGLPSRDQPPRARGRPAARRTARWTIRDRPRLRPRSRGTGRGGGGEPGRGSGAVRGRRRPYHCELALRLRRTPVELAPTKQGAKRLRELAEEALPVFEAAGDEWALAVAWGSLLLAEDMDGGSRRSGRRSGRARGRAWRRAD